MLSVHNLHKSYQVGKTTYEVLKGVSLQVEEGEFVAVMGPSGSGKTTLLNCISCYIPADSGSITLGGKEIARLDEDALARVRNRKLGFVFQASRLPVALRSSASAKLYQKWSKTPELRGFRGFSFSNGLTQFDRTKPLLTRFLWVKWWTTTPKRGLMG